jgi:hypothetical protein
MQTDRTTKALLGLIAIGLFLNLFVPLLQPPVVNVQDLTTESELPISRDDFVRLLASDGIREGTGLSRDRLHWRILILDPETASSEYWEGVPSEPGRKTIVVFLDHPNGVDRTRYESTYSLLEDTARTSRL